eukprot:TRINITY_DN1238_c0_g1_i1.p1 TRINITY_DN1238_c0_g1~~TRINITY_DN1238_c0_g1_i1.p1  ORF type:complete len:572 (+),score=52.82 TRINITY_DN1238_c0_g1_i1:2975-4690(+)
MLEGKFQRSATIYQRVPMKRNSNFILPMFITIIIAVYLSPGGRRTFLTGIRGETGLDQVKSEKLARNMERINRLHNQLNTMLDQYGSSLLHKVEKEDEDYLLAYKAEMLKIQKKLDIVRDNTETMRMSLQAGDYIAALERSLAWFKEEAGRLSQGIDDQQRDIAFWKEKIEILENDIKELNEDLKATTEEFKALEIASGQSEDLAGLRPQTVEKMRKGKAEVTKPKTAAYNVRNRSEIPKICHIMDYMLRNGEDKGKITEEIVKYHSSQIEKNEKMLESLEQKIKLVATQNIKPMASRQIRHTQLLEVFLDGVERVKSQISRRVTQYGKGFFKPQNRRRAFSAVNNKKSRTISEKEAAQIKLSNFTATDKKAVFVQFMNSPDVYEKIRQIIDAELGKEMEKHEVKLAEPAQGIFDDKNENNNKANFEGITYTDMMAYGLKEAEEKDAIPRNKRFQASHLYAIPQAPEGFRPEAFKKRKIVSQSFYGGKSRPGTVGTRIKGLNRPSNPNNASFSVGFKKLHQPFLSIPYSKSVLFTCYYTIHNLLSCNNETLKYPQSIFIRYFKFMNPIRLP